MAGLPTYMAHHVVSAMFATDTARPRRSAGPTLQDRQGFHTFRRGDIVAYQKLEKGDAPYQAVVFGCMFKERGSGDADEGDGEESEHGGAGNEHTSYRRGRFSFSMIARRTSSFLAHGHTGSAYVSIAAHSLCHHSFPHPACVDSFRCLLSESSSGHAGEHIQLR